MNEQFKYLPNGVAKLIGVPESPEAEARRWEEKKKQWRNEDAQKLACMPSRESGMIWFFGFTT